MPVTHLSSKCMKTLLIGLENASTHRYNLLIFRLDPIYLFRVQLIQWTGLLFQYRMAPKPNNVVLYFLIGNSQNLYLLFFGIHSHILNLTAFIWQCELKIALLQISNILYFYTQCIDQCWPCNPNIEVFYQNMNNWKKSISN